MAGTRWSKQCQNSSVFNIRAKVLKSLQDLQLNEREFQTAGAVTLEQCRNFRFSFANRLNEFQL